MKQPDLFPETKPPRAPRRWRMTMTDAGANPCVGHPHVATFKCKRCGTESAWDSYETVAEIKRGIPCPKCNEPRVISGLKPSSSQ